MRTLKACLAIATLALACAQPPEQFESERSALITPTFVQVAWRTPQSASSTVAVPLNAAQGAGHLLVAVIGWNDTSRTITSVTDSRGDTWAVAAAMRRGTGLSQALYYAKNVASGSNTVTVKFNAGATAVDVRVLEYAGVDTASPLDGNAAGNGSGGTASTGNLTTTAAGDLLVAGDTVATGSHIPGSGYTVRVVTTPDEDMAEDRVAGSAGAYSASANVLAPAAWVIQVAAFKAASGSSDGGAGTSGSGGGGASGQGGAGGQDAFAGAGGGGQGGQDAAAGAGGQDAAGGSVGGQDAAAGAGGQDAAAGTGGGGVSGQGGADAGCSTYPLSVGADGRHLVTACGQPFLVAGDSPQCLSANLSPANMQTYYSVRATHGYNASWVNLLCTTYTGGRADASTYDGILPFTGTTGGVFDLTKPNPAYFARVDALVQAAAAAGTVVFLDPIETGGFLDVIRGNSQAARQGYGQFLGARYAASPNIVWMSGNDFRAYLSGSDDAAVKDVAIGIASADATKLQTIELDWPRESSTLDDDLWQAPFVGINLTYTYNPTYALLLHDYDRSPHLPNVMIEANYEGENNEGGPHVTNAHDTRTQMWWSVTSGATGSFFGNFWEVHALDNASFAANLASDDGAPQMAFVKSLLEPRAWSQLVPDEGHALLTAGFGTCMSKDAQQGDPPTAPNAQNDPCATAALAPGGHLALAYSPVAHSLTVALSQMAGPATARWYDPTNGSFQAISGSPFANSGTHVFATPGSNSAGDQDWVLLMEAP